jgi:DHA1 family tetracycline resistance protein-like MFS transporter
MLRVRKYSLYIVLFVAFIDLIGVGLIYPLFSSMLFDCTHCLVSEKTSHETRGLLLGILLAIMPMTQFFSAPFWGALSDSKGRKKPLQMSLAVAFFGYLVALGAVLANSLVLLIISRCIVGFSAGNMSIVQATIADVSTPNEKAKNFGIYAMAMGLGFTLGPFFGGVLSSWGYSIPFLFATIIVALNLAFALFFFQETHVNIVEKKLSWSLGIDHLRKAVLFKGVRVILLASFLHNFGWSYFFEFIPVHLISRFHFESLQLGFFYGVAGAIYALSSGVFIRPFVKRFKSETLFFGGNFITGVLILLMLSLSFLWELWIFVVLISFFVAFVFPSSTTLVSNHADPQIQGEALGVLASVNAVAYALSPLISGTFVGKEPTMSIWIGGIFMLVTALIVLVAFRKKLFQPRVH